MKMSIFLLCLAITYAIYVIVIRVLQHKGKDISLQHLKINIIIGAVLVIGQLIRLLCIT